ncbi:hypothetical protein B0H13DRAFT_982159 [Mycena leptocephala]|nr:hypothetical protein B0H13DRAFT_982159 [Mycena leptocephala]
MSSTPAKRQGTEDASITRSDVWYKDGSVVLQAQNTQSRVHWGVLSQHSSFFRDLQDLPQPPDHPTVDGCPIVELQDAAFDVEHLLKALYDPTFLLEKALPLPIVAALIRLGRKYNFQRLLDSAVERLTFENPSTLEEFDALNSEPLGMTYGPSRIVSYPGLLFDVLTLGRENDILSILPCAYYRLLEGDYSLAQLFDGVKRRDGTTASLAPIDLRRCILAREKLLKKRFHPGYTLEWIRKWEYDDCTKPEPCRLVRNTLLEFYVDTAAVGSLVGGRSLSGFCAHLCATCFEHATDSLTRGRKKMWEELPGFFDLPPWNELKNDL